MKMGARIVKTGLAIVVSLLVAQLLGLPSPVFAPIAAVFAIGPSVYRSYLTLKEQVQANVVGAVVAVVFVTAIGNNLLTVGFACIVAIAIMLKLQFEKSIGLALVTIVAIMEFKSPSGAGGTQAFLLFALMRFATIMIGVASAFTVNLLFFPPKYELKLFHKLQLMQEEITRWTRLASRQASEHTSTKSAVHSIRQNFNRAEALLSLYKEETSYFHREPITKARKLVIYRQMLLTSYRSYDVLKRLHKYENEVSELPEHFRMMIQERLGYLLTYHEQLFMKYSGTLKTDYSEHAEMPYHIRRQDVMELFLREINLTKQEEDFSVYHLLHVVSSILEYEEELEHFDTLVTSYHQFHGDEIHIELAKVE